MRKRMNVSTYLFSVVIFLSCVDVLCAQEPRWNKMSTYIHTLISRQGCSLSKAKVMSSSDNTVCSFIEIVGIDASRILSDNGCRQYARFGDIYIADIPIDRLSALSVMDDVKRIEAEKSCSLTLDTTAIIVDALPVYAGTSLPQAYTGKGVVVGIEDVGFDVTHPTFYSTDMKDYRIRAFWDQLSTDTVGSSLVVGRDYTNQADILSYARSRDSYLIGHGTHTSGIAVGSGYNTKYRGLAYESDICLVSNTVVNDTSLISKTDLPRYTSAVDLLGYKYLFDYAKEHGQPCVVSFSEGFYNDFSAECKLYAAALDSLVGPGRIFVCSAGNESQAPTYFKKSKTVKLAGSFLDSDTKSESLTIRADGPFAIHHFVYNGGLPTDTLTIKTSAVDSVYSDTLKCKNGNTYAVKIKRYVSSYAKTDSIYALTINGSSSFSTAYPVALVVDADTTEVEVLGSSSNKFLNNAIDTRWNAAEDSHNILMPGATDRAITVGATAWRTGFTNYLGTYVNTVQWGGGGKRSLYSSVGPTCEGLTKPDVVAPGNAIISALNSYYWEQNKNGWVCSTFDWNGRTYGWKADQGTSMSTPAVAGAIALWLQAKPDLTPEDVKQVLKKTCSHPDETLSYPNNYYGYGQIDVYKGLLNILGLDKIQNISSSNPKSVEIVPQQNGALKILFQVKPSCSTGVRIYSTSGILEYSTMLPFDGVSEYSIVQSSLNPGIHLVQIDSMDNKYSGSVLIRK